MNSGDDGGIGGGAKGAEGSNGGGGVTFYLDFHSLGKQRPHIHLSSH